MIERIAIAGRARARKRAADSLVAGLSAEHLTKLDGLLVVDSSLGITPFAWLKAMPIAPKADHIRELLDRLHLVRSIAIPAEMPAASTRSGYSSSYAKATPATPTNSGATPSTDGARSSWPLCSTSKPG